MCSAPARPELPDESPRQAAGRAATSSVQSLDRAVAILDCFTPEQPRLGVSDVARLTGLTTSTAHRLLVSLACHHLVRRMQDALLHEPLEAATAHTITEPAAMRAELDHIVDVGYTFSMEERIEGIRTVAAPIHDHTGAVGPSISVTGPASRVTRERLEEMTPLALSAAARISAELGHPDAPPSDHYRRPLPTPER